MYLKLIINLNTYAMKRLLFLTVLMITASVLSGQKSIDALFEKYAGKDGFVTFTISGNLLKLVCDNDEENDNPIPAKITEIRILAQEDDNMKVENFYDRVIKDLNLNDYEEFMRVKESDQDLRMLVRSEGNRFREFLLIAGGEDNALIQIKGSMTFKEAEKFSENTKKNHGVNFLAEHK
jgi:hypothetical protein